MSINTKKLTKGFTIIEVLIVLAIAGLILAIIFLAVPALQRNSRNTAIRSDAASVLGAVNDFIANNQGQLPTGASVAGNTVSVTGGSGTAASEAKVRGGTGVQWQTSSTPPAVLGTIYVVPNTKCNGNAFGTYNGSPRAIVAGFLIEATGSANTPQCIET